ncbi:NACHT and WD40 domain protein [Talaromyces stipitatus ATCC 10500]|uniref:NACHT and WD40 domain protein n=1 Tax=Talaromyces stipitatus (strain ATCC 10500 / CBS 375.48 / QM 6759 / NRRL 1006) TaxID=441959 RepID=B8MPL3_TALSN|nr:NACHT and WD40 domain protein [Talaromyces stipitatus ATCC 10500]EED14452.1 NACHT and WD40 domain protein [Talaromyces stipitatus ATCC 10500]
MKQSFDKLRRKLFHKDEPLPNARVRLENANSNGKTKDALKNTGMSPFPSESNVSQTRWNKNAQPQDMWQVAYSQLTTDDQQILSSAPLSDDSSRRHVRTKHVLDQVIQSTKEQYEAYQRGGFRIQRSRAEAINLRDTAQKILNAALSFEHIISAVVNFDPTGHASSAWMIVSLGLTMTQNHHDLRNALFESSELLANILARYAYIERIFYQENHSEMKVPIGNAIVRVYTAILQYAAEVWKVQKANIGRKVLESVTAITDQPLSKLKSYINEEEQSFQKWVQVDQYLHHRTEAENILVRIDEVIISIQDLHRTFDLSKLSIAEGASFDSYMDQHEDICLPGTRTELLQQIADWAQSPDGKHIYWLKGMAGTGKSTISRTMAKSFQEKRMLGASFFFKRGERDRATAQRFISTIMSQLIIEIPQLIPHISSAIKSDPNISCRSLKEQFNQLLLQPLCSLNPMQEQNRTIAFVFDALDECDKPNDIRAILQLLPEMQASTVIRCRTLLTSRPELPIQLGFKHMRDNDHQDMILQEIPIPVIKHDITLFLKHKFSEIRNDHSLPLDWPEESSIQTLVAMTVPLFISAATVCRFVGDLHWEPEVRLEKLLKDQSSYASKMEKTYLPILNQLLIGQEDEELEQLIQEFQDIIGVLIMLVTPLSLHALGQFLDVRPGAISNRLKFFHSVLSIPSDPDLPIRILHLSFRDFLLDSKRATSPFWVDKGEKHQTIALHCLRIMCHCLKKNICNLPSDGTYRTEICEQTISQHLPPALQYSCRYWIQHLVQSKDLTTGMEDAYSFLQKHFLHWLEAMSIMGVISEVVDAIDTLLSTIMAETEPQLSEFLRDGKRVILKYMQIADIAPLQLYCAGLFIEELPGWINRLPKVEETWSALQQTFEGHSHWVQSVAFSPDGRLLASGSADRTVKIWDTSTGALQQTLESHSDWVQLVTFSLDGRLLASGSRDRTIKLWDTASGALQKTFESPLEWVLAVAFLPDGRLLASGSEDRTVKLWDTATGALQQTLDSHSERVRSVALSPDGRLLVSGSEDGRVKLWDTASAALQQTLESHSRGILAVAFSPDGRLLASSSQDDTVKLWDTATGALQKTLESQSEWFWSVIFSPDGRLLALGSSQRKITLWDTATNALQQILEGHSQRIEAMEFSPDGRLLASGSSDKTVKLWDTTSGALQKSLKGHSRLQGSGSNDTKFKLWDTATGLLQQTLDSHSKMVWSVAFSLDGRLLASGSADRTVKIWDTSTGALKQTLEDHSDLVSSVVFSPDGWMLASGSNDMTVKLWDTSTGALRRTLGGHSEWVRSVVFSPDGRLLASGSDDMTVKLWNTATGAPQQTLKGHLERVWSVAFSPDGRLLASGAEDGTVKLWDTATGALQQTLESHLEGVRSVAFSPDGRMLASGSIDTTVKLWDTATGDLQQTLEDHLSWVQSVAFSPDGRLLASGSMDRTLNLWNTSSGALQQTFMGHSCVLTVAFLSDGRLLASGSENSIVRLWDTGALRQTLEGHSDLVESVAFSPDGRMLASGSHDMTVKFWDTATGALQQTLGGHSNWVRSVVFSPDGRLLASGSDDMTVKLWNTATGAPQQTLKGHLKRVWSVVFSLDSRLLASGSEDGTIKIWDTATGALQQNFEGRLERVWSVAFSPDGRMLASGSEDGTVKLWDTATGTLQQTLDGHLERARAVAFSPDGRVLASGSKDMTVKLWDTATGALQQSLTTSGVITNLEFSKYNPYLSTNMGLLNIQPWYNNHTSYLAKSNVEEVLIQDNQWVILRGKQVLWLPPEYRPVCSTFRMDGTFVLGHASGRISFIRVHA